MTLIKIDPLDQNLAFGARVLGLTPDALQDEAVRGQLRALFEDRGLIVFAEVEQTQQMHVALSEVFGALKEHPVRTVTRVDQQMLPGVIDMRHDPDDAQLVEVNGQLLSSWLPWHFDHCYNNELNRAGVLRAIVIAPEGGMTCFADGIELYQNFSPELRQGLEGEK
jgi:taurine dioxygenase